MNISFLSGSKLSLRETLPGEGHLCTHAAVTQPSCGLDLGVHCASLHAKAEGSQTQLAVLLKR